MKESFEKILDRFGELHERYVNQYGVVGGNPMAFSVKECMEIVHEVAEEYNGGWIACSERLPEDFMSMEYLTTVNGHFYSEINYYCVANHKWFSSRKTTKEVDVIAWQPLPERFKERD